MKRALIRVLYGEPNNPEHDYKGSRNRLDKDIKNILSNKENEGFYTYVLGEYNYNYLKCLGMENVVLADRNPYVQGGFPGNYTNKIECIKHAMEDFDEIVFMDWDTVQTKPFPKDFWDDFQKKEVIQAPLYKGPRAVMDWRGHFTGRDNKRLSGGCFVYMRDKMIPDKLLKMIEDPKLPNKWADEIFFSKYMDDLCGGWEGIEKYYRLFEPKWCELIHSTFREDKKDACFYHPRKGR